MARPRKLTPPDTQADFFTPALYDVAAKDGRALMHVAPFRLSKRDKRKGDIQVYELPDGHIEVSSGAYGMATVWDYDIVLMAISHLAEAVNRYRKGQAALPSRVLQLHPGEIIRFCRMSDGGRQYTAIEGAIDRLRTTVVKSVRQVEGQKREAWAPEGLIAEGSRTVSDLETGRVSLVEIAIPRWIYEEIVQADRPEILTVHPDYFLLERGIARFLYRLARQSAGRGQWEWLFKTLHERSGSGGEPKEFNRMLRQIIRENAIPEYELREEGGKSGPKLIVTHIDAIHPISGWVIDGNMAQNENTK